MQATTQERLERAYCSLEGLSVGDGFGEQFFVAPYIVDSLIEKRALFEPPWEFTDDTNMALSIVAILRQESKIEQDKLALSFAERYDPSRGYGPAMHGFMAKIQGGEYWRKAASSLFVGQGSFGNGAAMRVAPLGAYFADDLDLAVEQARLSAQITHAHPEGIAGAIAVAVAAGLASRFREEATLPQPNNFLEAVLPFVPESQVRAKMMQSLNFAPDISVKQVAARLGSGDKVTAQDTVPFALWCAALQLANYQEALWLTVSGLGDRDTTCAIVGGIVASYTGVEAIPLTWREYRESLPEWPFAEVGGMLKIRVFSSI